MCFKLIASFLCSFLVVKDLTGQDLKTEDSVRPPFAFSQSMLPLGLANPSLDVSIRSRLVAREASLGGSLALIAIALPHGSLPGVLLVKGQGIQEAADPSYSIPACVVGAASEGEDAQDGQDGTQEEPLLPSGSSDEGSVAESSSSSSSSGDGSVVDPEMLSNYTLAELHYQRIGCIQDLAIYHREVSNVHQYGREGCFQTRHTDRHSLRKNVARGIAQNQEACARERRLVVLQEDLQQVERALQLRGGLEPGYMEEFLATKSPSQLFNRHFELWKYYNAVMQRKTDLQFSLGSMDGPYTFQVPPEDVAETRVTLVKAITEADSICGRVSLEMLALEAFMYK